MIIKRIIYIFQLGEISIDRMQYFIIRYDYFRSVDFNNLLKTMFGLFVDSHKRYFIDFLQCTLYRLLQKKKKNQYKKYHSCRFQEFLLILLHTIENMFVINDAIVSIMIFFAIIIKFSGWYSLFNVFWLKKNSYSPTFKFCS